jgi:ribosomal protein L29
MKTSDLKNMSVAELNAHITKLRQEYITRRETVQSGRDKNNAALKQLRRDIARAKTIEKSHE